MPDTPSVPSVLVGLPSLLDRLGLTQNALADGAGVRRETVSRWLNGHKTPQGRNLASVLTFLRTHDPSITYNDFMHAA